MSEQDFQAWLKKQNLSESHSQKYKLDVRKTAPRKKNEGPTKTIILPLSIENNATIQEQLQSLNILVKNLKFHVHIQKWFYPTMKFWRLLTLKLQESIMNSFICFRNIKMKWLSLRNNWKVLRNISSIPGLFSLQRMPPPLLFQAIVRVRVRAIVLLFLGLGLGLKC